MKIMAVGIGVLAVCAFLLLLYARHYRRKALEYKAQADENMANYSRAVERVAELQKAAALANQNRREADEKIDALHSGDTVGNALDVLSH